MSETLRALYKNESMNFCKIAKGETKKHEMNASRSFAILHETVFIVKHGELLDPCQIQNNLRCFYLRKNGLAEEQMFSQLNCETAGSLSKDAVDDFITLGRDVFKSWNMPESLLQRPDRLPALASSRYSRL